MQDGVGITTNLKYSALIVCSSIKCCSIISRVFSLYQAFIRSVPYKASIEVCKHCKCSCCRHFENGSIQAASSITDHPVKVPISTLKQSSGRPPSIGSKCKGT